MDTFFFSLSTSAKYGPRGASILNSGVDENGDILERERKNPPHYHAKIVHKKHTHAAGHSWNFVFRLIKSPQLLCSGHYILEHSAMDTECINCVYINAPSSRYEANSVASPGG